MDENLCEECCPQDCNCSCHGEHGKTKWISVKDRMPESCKRVLVVSKDGWIEIDKRCWDHVLLNECWDNEPEITHWAELPEPPKEDKRKEEARHYHFKTKKEMKIAMRFDYNPWSTFSYGKKQKD